jgi:hypothetical protein
MKTARAVLQIEGSGDIEGALDEFIRMAEKAGGFETGGGSLDSLTIEEVEDTTVERVRFRVQRVPAYDEYHVLVYEAGKLNGERTYFTDDLEDAKLTKLAMEAEEEKNRCQDR